MNDTKTKLRGRPIVPDDKKARISQISLPPKLITMVEEMAAALEVPKSRIVQDALRRYLEGDACKRCGCTELLCGHNRRS